VALKDAGCKIIVDDVSYFDESPFRKPGRQRREHSDGGGVLYFSSAANSGNKDHERRERGRATSTVRAARSWAPRATSATAAGSIQMIANSANPITLHWNDPFSGSANDYDLYVLNSTLTTVLDSSTNVQSGFQDPFEIVGSISYTTGMRIVVVQHAGAASRTINVATNRGRLDATLATAGNVRGHNGSNTTVSVAATPAAGAFGPPQPDRPLSPFSATNKAELFTSDGAARRAFRLRRQFPAGAPVGSATPMRRGAVQSRTSPPPTGVATAPGFSSFYGVGRRTSCRGDRARSSQQAFPAMTPAQLKAALMGSTIDIEAAGWDAVTGNGIAMAYETLQAQGAVPHSNITLGTVTRRRSRQRRRVRRSGRGLEVRHHARQRRWSRPIASWPR
jgi:hypothetical protein